MTSASARPATPSSARPKVSVDCQPAVKSDTERGLDLGACSADGELTANIPAFDAYGWKADDLWCSSGPMQQCGRDEPTCECLFTGCSPAPAAHCFEIAACVDGRIRSELTCYRTAKDCEKSRPMFGMQGSTCHVLGRVDAAPSSVPAASGSAAPADGAPRTGLRACDPTKPNSDGTPKRAKASHSDTRGETLVLRYEDFGPQVSASSLLGMEWWSWEAGGSFEFCDAFDIRVVVYRRVSRAIAQARHPSAASKKDLVERGLADVRYVAYHEALAHLDAEIADVRGEPELENMSRTLKATRRRIVEQLGQ